MFAYMTFCRQYNKSVKHLPETPYTKNGLIQMIKINKSLVQSEKKYLLKKNKCLIAIKRLMKKLKK